ncbi:MAG: hypothetical protein LIP02_02155 [Bacteroidales bacterium]|nr:hypothetical protein [Bacteroidales bacterium]
MKGKVFKEHANIYQDEAQILFNFYRQAAEKIVAEEERIEGEVEKLQRERADIEERMSKLWYWFLGIITFFMYFIKKKECERQIAYIDERIDNFQKVYDEIFRDYRVNRLGVAYVPVAEQVKYDDKSFVVDLTGQTQESEVTVQMSRQSDLLAQSVNRLQDLSKEAPIVETANETEEIATDQYSASIQNMNQYDYMGALDRTLRTISFCMSDLDTSSVRLPLVADQSQRLEELHEYGATEVPEGSPVVNVYDRNRYAEPIKRFQDLARLKDSLSNESQQFEDVLKGLMHTMAQSVQAVSALKLSSVDKVVTDSNRLLYTILKAPYNQYSPLLEYEEIDRIKNETFDFTDDAQGYEPFNLKQSSRVKYNLPAGVWQAEDGSTTGMPFGVHQIYEEIVAPMVQSLMQENRIERLKIYNHIKDQKLSYLNKWHQDTDAFYRANRAESADIINLMQESLRQYIAAYNTLASLKRTEDSMAESGEELNSTVVKTVENTGETVAAFDLQSRQFQQTQLDFEDYMLRLKDDIDEKAARFGHVEYYEARLRDGHSNEVAVATSEVSQLDERRRPLAAAHPVLAKESELPPEPSIEPLAYEQLSINLPAIAREALGNLGTLDRQIIREATEIISDDTPEPESPKDDTAPESPRGVTSLQQENDNAPEEEDQEMKELEEMEQELEIEPEIEEEEELDIEIEPQFDEEPENDQPTGATPPPLPGNNQPNQGPVPPKFNI